MSSKDSLKDLRPQLYHSRQTQEMGAVREWLRHSVEELKERALLVTPADLPALQGEARGFKRLLRTIDERPLNID